MAGRPARKAKQEQARRAASTAGVDSLRGPLLVGRSVANKPVYRGRLQPPSEATLAKRAMERRMVARPVCPECFQHVAANGSCGC